MAKRTITLQARLKWPDVQNDFLIWQEDRAIGRIRLVADPAVPAAPWEWFVTVPLALPEWTGGTAETRDACMKNFSAAWGRFLKETPPARLARAWEFERAAESRRPQDAPRATLPGSQEAS